MKSYLKLIPISARVHKYQNRMTLVCIALAVFLVTAIFSMADMELRSQKMRAIKEYGNWHIRLSNLQESDAQLLSARPDVAASSWYDTLNYRLQDGYSISGKDTVICGVEQDLVTEIAMGTIVEGTYPQNDRQIILTENAKSILDVKVGDTVALDNPAGTAIEFTIAGFGMDSSMVMKEDALGAFMTTDAFKTVYQTVENKVLADSDMVYYVQFSDSCNIRKAIADIYEQYGLTDKDIAENTALLGTMGLSDNSYMLGLYLVALVLFLLVLTAGVFMIASSLNSNIVQRTEFFGMLRCIGASKKQIIRFVRLESLNWCKIVIPIGIFAGVIMVWGLCAILRYVGESYFAQMPVFGVSPIGIISGAVVGVLTVLFAAQSPAKRAAKVSPLAAVSGNASAVQNIRKAANTRLYRIDTALGVHHAKMNKKNFILMVGSFALSIVLFMSFSVFVDFMYHAIRPLKPYAPDLSIISPDNTCSIDKDFIHELKAVQHVKRVFGRSFSYNIPAKLENQALNVDLVSYETYQFNWVEECGYLLDGTLTEVLSDENYVLTVYKPGNPLKVGDKIRLNNSNVTVAGILSTSPFDSEPNTQTIISSEATFEKLTGQGNYTIIDIQLSNKATDETANTIRNLAGGGITFSDRRLSNREAKGSYWSFALFVYGFLAVIAMITAFNVINSISMNVSARIKQYGAMRAIGMDRRQLVRMIAAEAVTYGIAGSAAGCMLGLPIHSFLFNNLVTQRWGDPWQIPFTALGLIVALVAISSVLAVRGPVKRIWDMPVTNTISAW